MNTFLAAEDALLELSRWQRMADKATLRLLTLIEAGVPADEAKQIMADITEIEPELERAAA